LLQVGRTQALTGADERRGKEMTEGTEDTPASAPVHAFVHTPGPWEVRDHEGLFAIAHPTGWVMESSDEQQNRTDARLIAAAPDLLAHLRHMIWLVEIELKEDGGHIIAGAKAAVQKAISVV